MQRLDIYSWRNCIRFDGLTTFFTIYAKKALRERRIPFEIEAPVSVDYVEAAQGEAVGRTELF